MAHLDLSQPTHAYFFGFLQTDGSHYAGTGRKGKVTIEIGHRDRDVLFRFRTLFSFYSSITDRTRRTNFSSSATSTTWAAFDETFRLELTALGVGPGRKSATTAPPNVPFRHRDYLRGLIDGDGSVGFTAQGYPFVSFTTTSEALCRYFCDQVEMVTGARRDVGRNTRDGVFNPIVMCDPAATLARWLYPPGCLALARKSSAARDVGEWLRPPGMRSRPAARAAWTEEHDAVVLATPSNQAAALQLGRSVQSVNLRRWRLRKQQPG